MRSFVRFFYVFLYLHCSFCLIGVGGCATTIQTPKHLKTLNKPNTSSLNKKLTKLYHFENFEALGKVGFSDGNTGGNASILWKQNGDNYDIRLFGPLGSGSVQIIGNTKQVTLIREDGTISHAKNPERLVEKELDWIIPISGLRYWIRGIPAPGTPPRQIEADDENRLWQIKQHGWTIDYQAYQELPGSLSVPSKLLLQNGSLRLKIIFRRWQLN